MRVVVVVWASIGAGSSDYPTPSPVVPYLIVVVGRGSVCLAVCRSRAVSYSPLIIAQVATAQGRPKKKVTSIKASNMVRFSCVELCGTELRNNYYIANPMPTR